MRQTRNNCKLCGTCMGNNPMVGATVAVAVSVQQAADEGKF